MISGRAILGGVGLVALVMLAACSSRNEGLVARSLPLLTGLILPADTPPPEPVVVTRATLNSVPFATISISQKERETATSFIVAVANNNGYVTYQEPSGRSIVLFGGLLTSTNGLGLDLAAIKHQVDDPVAVKTPISEWPKGVTRNYQFSLAGRDNYQITVLCRSKFVARERIEVVELFFDVTRVQETCRSPRREFTNLYWVADDGQIWQSEQWTGPELGTFKIQTIRPFST